MPESLQDLLDAVGNPIHYLRNLETNAFAFPVVPSVYTSWQNEQRAWRETVALSDQTWHMASLRLRGRDALKLLQGLGVNSFSTFGPGKAKQFVACNADGHVIGDAVLVFNAVNDLSLIGRPPALNWVQFQAASGGHEIDLERRDRVAPTWGGQAIEREHYRFQIQGPNAPQLFEALHGGPLPEVKYFNVGTINIGPRKAKALRHSMAGVPGLELWGPYEEGPEVHARIVETGRAFGLRLVGSLAYSTTTGEADWIASPVPAVYTGEALKSYRKWLPAKGYEAFNAVGGSFNSPDIEDYYVTPYALGYGHIVKFDHDFIGRDALEGMAPASERKKVTFVWRPEDVLAIVASNLNPNERNPIKALYLPSPNYAAAPYDKVVTPSGQVVGISMWNSYSYNERSVLSVGIVDPNVQLGDVLSLVWGEEEGGTRKWTVEPHRQFSVGVKIAPAPFASGSEANRRDSWIR